MEKKRLWDEVKIIDWEEHWRIRRLKESAHGEVDKVFDWEVILDVAGSISTTGKITRNTFDSLTLVPKSREYKDEENSLNILSDKNYQVSSQKFRQMTGNEGIL